MCSWTVRGLWGFEEVRTYECSTHGPVFVKAQAPAAESAGKAAPGSDAGNSDRDSLVTAPRTPAPTLDAGAIAVPEPDQHDR